MILRLLRILRASRRERRREFIPVIWTDWRPEYEAHLAATGWRKHERDAWYYTWRAEDVAHHPV